MMHDDSWDQNGVRQDKIEIRACGCGAVHLSLFGRTTFHLSRSEYIDFARGVEKVAKMLRESHEEEPFMTQAGNGISH